MNHDDGLTLDERATKAMRQQSVTIPCSRCDDFAYLNWQWNGKPMCGACYYRACDDDYITKQKATMSDDKKAATCKHACIFFLALALGLGINKLVIWAKSPGEPQQLSPEAEMLIESIRTSQDWHVDWWYEDCIANGTMKVKIDMDSRLLPRESVQLHGYDFSRADRRAICAAAAEMYDEIKRRDLAKTLGRNKK